MKCKILLFAVVASLVAPQVTAEESPLPEPLTLEAALAQASSPHFDLLRARAEVAAREAELDRVQADDNWRLSLQGRLRWIDPNPLALDKSNNDNAATLSLSRKLYDFGRQGAREDAAASELAGQSAMLEAQELHRRLDILKAYFEVLLADMAYRVENEDIAITYIRLDKLRDRAELGQVSDVELLRAESEYQAVLTRRARAEAAMRNTRARLAETLNRPEELSNNLNPPELKALLEREIPELADLQSQALAGNLEIKNLQERLQAAQSHIEAARGLSKPTVHGELATSTYSRDLSGRDEGLAGVVIDIPLWTGGAVDAEVAAAVAEKMRLQSELAATEMRVRQQARELWEALHNFSQASAADQALTDYRELYLERSRALYEMEVSTDFGDSLVEQSRAAYQTMKTNFERALAWAQLDILRGRVPDLNATQAEGES